MCSCDLGQHAHIYIYTGGLGVVMEPCNACIMCDLFWASPVEGDLSDVVRGSLQPAAPPLQLPAEEEEEEEGAYGELQGMSSDHILLRSSPSAAGIDEDDDMMMRMSWTMSPTPADAPAINMKGSRTRQTKKVVCIPGGGGGGGVPSDVWAWRKYGQKPIKGSPYPRGYYRCSSSKGCPARKQVERSRADPAMLVITYTSDHDHPWPTRRNALAGSTRPSSSAAAATIAMPPPAHHTHHLLPNVSNISSPQQQAPPPPPLLFHPSSLSFFDFDSSSSGDPNI